MKKDQRLGLIADEIEWITFLDWHLVSILFHSMNYFQLFFPFKVIHIKIAYDEEFLTILQVLLIQDK